MEKNPEVFVIPPLSYSLCELGQHIRAFVAGLSWVLGNADENQ